MMNLKKVIASLLILACFGTNAFAFSSETLSQLGLEINNDESHLVLRSEFVENVLEMLDISPTDDAKQVFKDVTKEDKCFGTVMAAYNNGIVRGEPGLTFRPNDPVTYEEAIRVFVDVLGYNGYIKAGMSYIAVADMIEITSGINYSVKNYVNEANMTKMFLNAIDIPMPEIKIVDGEIEYNTDGETILEKRYNIKKGRGIVKSVGEYALDENATVGEEYVRIEDEVFATGGKDFSKYFGMMVDYLYTEDEGDFVVVTMEKSSQSEVFNFNLYEIEKYAERKVYYIAESGKEKYVKLSDDVFIIYNGAVISKFSEDLFLGDNGSVKFICNDGNLCDVVIINEYDDYFVDNIDLKNSVIYDKYNKDTKTKQARTLDLSKVDEEDIVLVNGKVIAISDIGINNIVSVLKNEKGEIEKVFVSEDYEEGRISFFDKDEKTVVVEGNEYKVSDNLLKNEEIKIGGIGKFYFNVNGLISAVSIEKNGQWEYGFVRKVWDDEENDIFYIKILTTGNQMKTFELTEKFSLDGRRDQYTIYALKSAMSDNIGFLPQVIRYTLNYDGKVSAIDTVNNGDGENKMVSLANIYEKTANVRYIAGSAGFANRLPVTAKTVFFKVPDESTAKTRGSYSDDKYKVMSASEFKTDTRHDIAGYASGKSPYLPDVIVKYAAGETMDTTSGICIVSAISDGLNQDDEVVKNIEYWCEGVKGNKVLESLSVIDNIGLGIGDVVRMNFTDDGEISYIQKLYSVSDGTDDTKAFQNVVANSAIDTHAQSMFTKAHVYDKESSLLFVARNADIKANADKGLSLNNMAVYDTSSAAIIVYDEDEHEKVREGGLWDIKTTSSATDTGDMVILHVRYSKLMTVYVIK